MNWARMATVAVFYPLIVLLGIALLAAVQLRSGGGASYDTWRLNHEASRVRNERLAQDIRVLGDKAKEAASGMLGNELCLRLFDPATGAPLPGQVDEITARKVMEARQKETPFQKLFGDVNCLVKGYAVVKMDIDYFKTLSSEHASELADLKQALAANTEQQAELAKGHQDFLAFQEMQKTAALRPFVMAPYDLLVLLLVMMMGALGGMVRLLRDYGAADHPNPTASEYLLIPLIGAVVSIGGYVLAKCGLLLLSSSGGESALSPFMISLVGIVSGLLAKEVVDTISSRGRKLLAGAGEGAQP